jgi:hypothetical protein
MPVGCQDLFESLINSFLLDSSQGRKVINELVLEILPSDFLLDITDLKETLFYHGGFLIFSG